MNATLLVMTGGAIGAAARYHLGRLIFHLGGMGFPYGTLVANVSASAVTDPETIRQNLVKQVTGRVRWTESVQYMVGQGVTTTGEAGSGKVLTVMQRRIEKSLNGLTLGSPEDLEAFAKAIKG